MQQHDYLPRVADRVLARRLETSGAVVIEGPKACGKTELARRLAGSEVLLDTDREAKFAASVDPGLLLDGVRPRLIDEWQTVPEVWNHVRRAVDDERAPGRFILTGSSVPPDDVARHVGAGRMSTIRLRTMSLFESGRATGEVSLASLFDGAAPAVGERHYPLDALCGDIVRGGWPSQVSTPVDDAAEAARDYLEQTVQVDVGRVAGGHRDPVKVRSLVASLARNVATEVSVSTLADDAGGSDGALARETISDYLDVLRRLMIVDEQPAWSVRLRSRATLRSAPKRHLVDPSLAAAALGAGPERLRGDLGYLGCLFESLVVRDLRVASLPLRGQISHYRDSNGLEVDAVIEVTGGRWAAVEIKLGPAAVDDAAATLRRFAQTVDTSVVGEPAFLAVIVPGGYAYTRPDGVLVVPAVTLGP